MEIYIENEKTNALCIREVWLSRGENLILNPETLANLFNSDEKTIKEIILKNKGKVSKCGVISFKNAKLTNNFENDLKEKFSDFLVTRKIMNEEVPNFNYENYEKPGISNVFESAWTIPIVLGLIFLTTIVVGVCVDIFCF